MNSMQYSDNLCQAIEIIANNVVRGLSFDKTILCTVTNNLKAKQGEYSVSDGASTFTAFSTDQTLKLKDQVYVLIPNGSHQSQKIIVSKYNSKTDSNKGYSMPIDTIIPVEKLSLPTTSQGEIGIIANNSNRQQAGEFIINPNDTEYSELSFGPSYTRFSVTGKFKTNLTSVVQGDYSIVIILNGEDVNTQDRKDKKYIFNCSDFFGNPYQLITYTEQSIVFDISDFKKINTINIRFQESGNFYNTEGDLYPISAIDNLFVKDLEIVFGFDINEFENNDLLITSKKDLLYNTEGEKDVKLNWVRTRNNNTLFGIDSKTDISLTNYNYLRHLWRENPDTGEDPKYYEGKSKSYISMYWYNYVLENIPTDLLLKEDLWKVTNHYNNQFYSSSSLNGSTVNTGIFQFKFNPSITTPREKVKAVVAISGCLSKKVLKTQEIEINNGIQEVVLLNTEEDSDGNLIPELPSYDYIYYSPEDEIDVSEIFDNADTEEFKAYYMNNDNEYQENGVYKKEEVEWVQYYKQEELSIKENGTIEYKNGAPVYGGPTFVYLTESQFNTLKNETYTDSQNSSKIVNRYKLELTPLTLLKSNELIFINNNSNHSYEKLNLINNMKLECLDNSKGRYFIYRLDNTISSNAANNGNRKIQVSFNSINSVDVKTDNIKIQWKIPKNNTMITKPTRIELDANLYEGIRGKINPENSDETEKESIITWTETSTHWVSNEITIKNTASGDGTDGTQVITMSIPYQIKSYYSPGFTNNKIICLVKKVVNGATEEDVTINEKEFELLFGPSGTNGTSYTLTLSFGEKYDNNFKIISNEKQSFLRRGTNESTNPWVLIEAHLFDGDNQVLDSSLNVNFSWYVNPTYDSTNNKTTVKLNTSRGTSNQCFIKSAYDESSNNFSASQHCAILQASISYQGKQLTSYLPIPMCFYNTVYGFEGTDKIIYNANGTSPQYYKNELKIFNQNNEEIKNSNYHYWIYIDREYSGDLSAEEQKFYPQIIKDEAANTYHLIAPEVFYRNTSKIISLRLRNKDTTGTVFMQPILILQNQFGNSMLNDWDENLLIDEENNSILAAQIAAGSKDTNNTFTGVLMGSVSEKDTDNSTPKSGLYGYHQGILSFGFKEDGTAFIGKSGRGRIEFNGNNGTITSSNWTTNNLGMHLNLDTGVAQFKNTGGSVVINPTQSNRLFRISTVSGSILMNVGDNSYYLQSVGYQSDNSGFRLNLASNGFTLRQLLSAEAAESEAGILLSSSNDTHFKISKNVKRMAKSIACTINKISTASEKYDFYVHEKGTRLIVKKASDNAQSFYLSNDSSLINSELFRERVEIASSSRTNSWKYRLLWELINEYNQLSALNFTSTSTGGAWSYNSSSDYYEYTNPDTEATTRFYAAEYSSGSVNTNTKWCNAGAANELNCLTYHCHSNTLFAAIGRDVYQNEEGKNVANPLKLGGYRCVFNTSKNVTSWLRRTVNLKDSSNNNINVNSWQIAIPYVKTNASANQPLYVLAGKIYKFSIPTDYTLGNTLKADANPIQPEAFYNSSYNKKVNGKYFTYQGMAVDSKYFYFPAMRTNGTTDEYDCQIIDVRDRNTGKRIDVSGGHVETDSDGNNWKFIKIDNVLPGYEVEDISFNENFMMLSFLNISGGQYLSKIYRIPYSSANGLPGKIDLREATAIFEIPQYPQQRNIYNGTSQNTATVSKSKDFFTTRKTSQGFTFYYDSVIGDYVFVTAYVFKNTTENDKDQVLVLNTFKEMKAISSRKTIDLINIGSSSFYLQSANYDSASQTGTYFNLKTGSLITNTGTIGGWNIKPGYIDSSDTVEGKTSRMYIASNANSAANYIAAIYDGDYLFRVNREGKLFATGADISGKITATEGSFTNCTIKNGCKIGNWTIVSNHLSYNSGINSSGQGVFTNGKAFIAPSGVSASNAGENLPFTGNSATTKFVLGIGSRFGVTTYGTLCATNVNLSGTISASTITGGSITGSTITGSTITGGSITGGSITGSTITGGTFQTATSTTNSSRVVIDSNGDISCYYYDTLYGKITTTNTLTDKYWTLLGHLDPNWSSVAYRGITLGFDIGTWGSESTARYTLQATHHDFVGPVYLEEMWLDYGASNVRVLYYSDSAITLSGGSCLLKLSTTNGFQLVNTLYSDLMTINKGFSDNQIHFQRPTHFGSTVYNSAGGVAFTSDRNAKNSILPLTENHEIFFNNLKPMIFKYNNGTSDRFHTGFIAQDVLVAIENCGLTTQDVGAYISHEVMLENDSYIEQALRYDEFIALNTHMIQKCLKRINELENEIKTLKAQL